MNNSHVPGPGEYLVEYLYTLRLIGMNDSHVERLMSNSHVELMSNSDIEASYVTQMWRA